MFVELGDNPRALAHKAIDKYLIEHALLPINESTHWVADKWLISKLPDIALYPPNSVMPVNEDYIKQALTAVQQPAAETTPITQEAAQ